MSGSDIELYSGTASFGARLDPTVDLILMTDLNTQRSFRSLS